VDLLVQTLELDSRMGFAYERSVGYDKPDHVHPRSMLVCPRGACRMDVATASDTYRIDSTQVLWVPEGLKHSDEAESAIYETLALYPDSTLVEELIKENGLTDAERKQLLTKCHKLKRSRWLDDILDRYFFERVVNPKSPKGCTFFLEKQILNELARLMFREKFLAYGATVDYEPREVPEKALHYIEANLFEPLELESLAEAIGTTVSTLNRSFKKSFRFNPYHYIRTRRLDEAAALLKRGQYPVSDIAQLVGYENFSAFSKAFKLHFKATPQEYARRVNVLE